MTITLPVQGDVHKSNEPFTVESADVAKAALQNGCEIAVAWNISARSGQLVELPIIEHQIALVSNHLHHPAGRLFIPATARTSSGTSRIHFSISPSAIAR